MRTKKAFSVPIRTVTVFLGLMLCLQLLTVTVYAESDAEKANAALEDYLKGSMKLITNGGSWDEETQSGVNVSDDRLTYTIGLNQSGSTSEIDRLNFVVRKFENNFKPQIIISGSQHAQYFDNKYGPNINKTAVKIKKRPLADKSFTAKLALYPKGTYDGKIKNESIEPLAYRDFTIILKAKVPSVNVSIKAINSKTNAIIPNAGVNIYKDQNKTQIIYPNNGGYILDKGRIYYLWVKADGYNDYFAPMEVTEAGTIEVKLVPISAAINEYKLKINVRNPRGEAISNPAISVVIPADDPFDDEAEDEIISPNPDKTYTVNKNNGYNIKVSATGYKTLDGKNSFTMYNYTPSGENENISLDVILTDGNDQTDEFKKISKIKSIYDEMLGALRPNFTDDKNINDFIQKILKNNPKLSDVDFSDVTFEIASSDNEDYIAKNGAINYRKGILNDNFTSNINIIIDIKCKTESISTKSKVVTVGWDRDYYKKQMQIEAGMVTKQFLLKGQSINLDALESDFTLPTAIKENKREIWSEIDWSSSNNNVITFQSNPLRPFEKTVKVNKTGQEETVILKAKFIAVGNHLNSNLGESPENFPIIEKDFIVKVKAVPVQTEEELKVLLDTYYKDITDYITDEKSTLINVVDDLKLPRYTYIRDEHGHFIFNNKEITVTSDNPAATINGYRVNIDPFYTDNKSGKLIVKFTRNGITATKEIPFTIGTISDDILDKEIQSITLAKENYFEGIKGDNEDKDNITQNLRAFREMRIDSNGSPEWVYNIQNTSNTGIIADSFWTSAQSAEMEASGYNKFKSSNPNVIKHENLVVNRQTDTQTVTISSLLSSERYGRFAPLHSDNEKLQKLYKQPVSVELKVAGTVLLEPKANKDILNNTINMAYDIKKDISESADGNDIPIDMKWATKDAFNNLNKAILEAEEIAGNDNVKQKLVDDTQITVKRAIINFKALIRNGNRNDMSKPEIKYKKEAVKTKPVTNQSAIIDNVEYAPVYNYDYYVKNNPDILQAFNGDKKATLNHFVNYGMNEGRQGCEWFDVHYYKDTYKDLETVYGSDLKAYYLHYISYGKNEGRKGCEANISSPNMPVVAENNVDYSAVYDYDYYIAHNPDVLRAFKGDRTSTLNHFINCGMNEGRQACEWFDVNSYKNAYGDLRSVFKQDLKAYYLHFMNYGCDEGRIAVDVTTITDPISGINGADYSPVYDYNYYLDNNPDIKAAFNGDEEATLNHFIVYGMAEGRIARPEFNVWVYQANHEDLRAAFGSDMKSYYIHYINYGVNERRTAQ